LFLSNNNNNNNNTAEEKATLWSQTCLKSARKRWVVELWCFRVCGLVCVSYVCASRVKFDISRHPPHQSRSNRSSEKSKNQWTVSENAQRLLAC